MRSEEDLVLTMRAAAAQTRLPPDLASGVAGRRRARRVRKRVGAALAAAAVATVIGGISVGTSGQERTVRPAASPSPAIRPSAIRPATEVWPEAVTRIPAVDRPLTALSATEVLLYRDERFEVYDSATGRTRVLGPVPAAPSRVAVGTQYIAWASAQLDLWVLPRQGGQARRVGKAAADVYELAVTDGFLVWSGERAGVYRMPLAGGTPELMPGAGVLRLASWPYAHEWDAAGNVTRIVDLETGRSTRVAVPEGADRWQCGPEWCTGLVNERPIVQRADGSGRRTLPPTLMGYGLWWLLDDRHALYRVHEPDVHQAGVPLAVVYDLATGTMGGVGERTPGVEGGDVGRVQDFPTLFWDAGARFYRHCADRSCEIRTRGGGKEYTVLNVASIRE
ncbi:hypothetical protein ACU635_03300 [[Actinomadura] parvosata]|uniref:hypothetical protein n=1 Tax=[Actinomadura] parvosata TaxID=1955412 RepID=UPI00406BE40D